MISALGGLSRKLRAGLDKHRGKSPAVVLEKAARAAVAMALGPVLLRACDEVGPRARSLGRTIVDNRGRITLGADFAANSVYAAVELASGPLGVLAIGDQVTINYGTSITATKEIRLGDRVSIGPYCVLCDSDVPAPLESSEGGRSAPIVLEEGVWLAGRVTVLPGAHIGAGATVSAGSVVSGYIPPGTVAAGIPARPLRVPGEARKGADRASRGVAGPSVLRGLVLSTFPASELCARLRDEDPPFVEAANEVIETGDLGEGATGSKGGFEGDVALVWTAPEKVLPALAELLSGRVGAGPLPDGATATEEPPSGGEATAPPERAHAPRAAPGQGPGGDFWGVLREQVDLYTAHVAARLGGCPCVIVVTLVVPPERRSPEVARVLHVANAHLAERLAEVLPKARLIDASRFLDAPEAWSPIMMYSAGVPFSLAAIAGAARDIKSALRQARGEGRTAVLLRSPTFGADPASRAAAADLEQALSELRHRGVAVRRIEPGQVPSPAEYGLSPGSCLYLCHDAAERARASEAVPGLLAPEIPSDPLLLPRVVRATATLGAP